MCFFVAPNIRRRLQKREEGERKPSATIKSQTNCSKFFFFFFWRMKPEWLCLSSYTCTCVFGMCGDIIIYEGGNNVTRFQRSSYIYKMYALLFFIGWLLIQWSVGPEGQGCSWTAGQGPGHQRGTRPRKGQAVERTNRVTATGLWSGTRSKLKFV